MLEVIPAILPKTFRELEEKLSFLKGATDKIQIDITDGKFAGDPSWPLAKHDNNFEDIVNEERGLPFWEDFEYEFDLLMNDPFSFAQDLVRAGAARIVFHADALNLDEDRILLDQMRTEGLVEVGIAIGLDTPEERIEELLPYADFIQCMGIENVGYQGQKFDPACLEKIKYVRNLHPHIPISVDGGITPDTAALVANAGADRVVAGSYILKSVNPIEAIRELEGI